MIARRGSPRRAMAVGFSAAAILGTPALATDDLAVYRAGFEPPAFSEGPLSTQDGWARYDVMSHVRVTQDARRNGKFGVGIVGSDLIPSDGLLVGAGVKFNPITGSADGLSVVEIEVDARLEGPGSDTGQGAADDLVSANLYSFVLQDDLVYTGGVAVLSSSGEIWSDGYRASVPAQLGRFYRLGIRIDLLNNTIQYSTNGRSLIVEPIGPWFTSRTVAGGAIEMAALSSPEGLANPYTASFDNYSIAAYRPVAVDVKPDKCPNTIDRNPAARIPVAILGSTDLAAGDVDPRSVRLLIGNDRNGLRPIQSYAADVATPFAPFTGKDTADDCNGAGADGFKDLVVVFNGKSIRNRLSNLKPGEPAWFKVVARLKNSAGGTPLLGEDVVLAN